MAKTATYRVTVDGADITSKLDPLLISLTINDQAGTHSDTADLELDDSDGVLLMPKAGAEIEIELGWQGEGLSAVFKGKVDEVRSKGARGGGRTLSITAKGIDTLGKTKQPQTKHLDNKSLKDALIEVGKAAGVTDVRVDPKLASIMRDYWSLDAESFLHFGQRIAREVGGTFKVQGTRAVLALRNGGKSPSGAMLPSFHAVWGENLIVWDIAPIVGRPRVKKVKARFYDAEEAKWKKVEADVEDEDAEAEHTHRHAGADEGEAKGRTDSDKATSEREKGEGTVQVDGSAEPRPEGTCILQGARPGADGTYRIDAVKHTAGRGGWTTELTLKQPQDSAGKDTRRAK